MPGRHVALEHFRNSGLHESRLASHQLFLSTTALGELNAGAAKSERPAEKYSLIEKFCHSAGIVDITPQTTEIYGEIWATLSNDGNLIPTNDIWIASSAIQHGIPLVSHDAHFDLVPGLEVIRWK